MKSWRKHWPALWLLLMLAFVAVVRIRLRELPLERDEGEYAYAGQLMLEGVPPYQLIYNMKMPGIYAAYALIMAVFGQSAAGIRLGCMLANMGAILLLYFVGRRFLERAGALAACATYALLSLSPRVAGFNTHATHFVVLAALAGTLVLLRAQERGGRAGVFWSGTLFGLAFLMKQHGGAFALFGGALIVWAAWRRKPPDWRTDGACLGLYAGGVLAPIVLTLLLLWRAGVWDRFWWWTVTYAGTHATALPWSQGKLRLADFFAQLTWDRVFWALALAGLILMLARKGRAGEKFFLLALLFFSALAVCPAFHFTSHYFVLMLPVVALLTAKLFAELAFWLAAQPLELARASPWILFGLIWGGVMWTYLGAFFMWPPHEVAERMYFKNNFQVYPVIADYLKSHTSPTAKMAILGSEPELCFYAHRRSVTGYIYMYDLVQNQPFRERMVKEMISEVEQARPDYVVVVANPSSWNPAPIEYFDQLREWFMPYTQSQYDPFGVVTFRLNQYLQQNQYFWGPHCLQEVPLSHRFVTIFQRKTTDGHPSMSAP